MGIKVKGGATDWRVGATLAVARGHGAGSMGDREGRPYDGMRSRVSSKLKTHDSKLARPYTPVPSKAGIMSSVAAAGSWQ